MKEQQDQRGVGIAFRQREEVEIRVSDVEVVDAVAGETGRDRGGFFFCFGEEDGKFLDGGHGNVTSVVAGQEGLVASQWTCSLAIDSCAYFALEIEEEDC